MIAEMWSHLLFNIIQSGTSHGKEKILIGILQFEDNLCHWVGDQCVSSGRWQNLIKPLNKSLFPSSCACILSNGKTDPSRHCTFLTICFAESEYFIALFYVQGRMNRLDKVRTKGLPYDAQNYFTWISKVCWKEI